MNPAELLPEFPRTLHLPYLPNTSRGDLVAKKEEAQAIFNGHLCLEEKIDGASVGMAMEVDGEAVIRNRTHILRKGYSKKTAAKMQFAPVWTWFYNHKKQFQAINRRVGCPVGVYGEWVLAVHTIIYNALPIEGRQNAHFIAYDVYDPIGRRFFAPPMARSYLQSAGFVLSGQLDIPHPLRYEALFAMTQNPSAYSSTEQREGIYLKVHDTQQITHRFKMRRPGFVPSEKWNPKKLTLQPRSLRCGLS